MSHQRCLPNLVTSRPTHQVRRSHSEENIGFSQARTIHRLRSLGQLYPQLDKSLPPLPLPSVHCISESERYTGCGKPSNAHIVDEQTYNSETVNLSHQETLLSHHGSGRANSASTEQKPMLDDLSKFLHFRGRLQELGCTFSRRGDILTYDKPGSDVDLHEMVRLGPMYDKLWSMFFNESTNDVAGDSLEPDLELFKRMLNNEGVWFDSQHKRVECGTSCQSLDRLTHHYDVLHANWAEKMLRNVHPAFRPGFCSENVPLTPTNASSGFFRIQEHEDKHVRKSSRHSNEIPVLGESQPSLHRDSGSRVADLNLVHPSRFDGANIGPPRSFCTTSLLRIGTAASTELSGIDPKTCRADSAKKADKTARDWEHGRGDTWAALGDGEQTPTRNQELNNEVNGEEFPSRESETRKVKKRRSLSFWVRSMFRSKEPKSS